MPFLACPTQAELSAYLLGSLPEGQSESLEQHADNCSSCQAKLTALETEGDDLVAGLRHLTELDAVVREPECAAALLRLAAMGGAPPTSLDPSVASPNPAPAMPVRAGELGRLRDYQLLAKLGEGGMGTVYKAVHTKLDKVVAIKLLPTERTRDAKAVARFEREMKAVGKLEHAHLVMAYDAGEADERHFLVMEYVAGVDLATLVQRQGALAVADACQLIRQAALGLEYAHQHGLVHRDIKPSNLMLTNEGAVKVLDLGLALLAGDTPAGEELTAANQMMGTADYMAPEQAGDSHSVDIRADIYSLGCTLYKLLAGHAPFSGQRFGTSIQKLMAHIEAPVPPLAERRADVPAAVTAVLEKMLAKKPVDRYATPAAVAEALAPFAVPHDLRKLASAVAAKMPTAVPDAATANTDAYLSSSMTGTHPSVGQAFQPDVATSESERNAAPRVPPAVEPPLPSFWGSKRNEFRPMTLIAAAASFLVLAGIVVVIRNSKNEPVGKVSVPDNRPVKLTHGGEELATIEDKVDGSEPATEIELPAGSSAAIEKDGQELARVRAGNSVGAPAAAKPPAIVVDPLPDLEPGAPLSTMALVQRPTVVSGLRSWTLETVGHRGRIYAIAYSHDGALLASSGHDGTVRIWDASTRRLVRALVGHSHLVKVLAWSPTRSRVASGSFDHTVRIWDTASGRLIWTLVGHKTVEALAWSPDGTTLAVGADDFVRLWNVETGETIETIAGFHVARAVAWSPRGETLAIGHATGVTLRDAKSGHSQNLSLVGDQETTSVAWSPDGSNLACGSGGHNAEVRLCNLTLGKIIATLPGHSHNVSRICWSREGKRLATAAAVDSRLRIWEAASGKLLHEIEAHARGAECIAWSPDGATIASAGADGAVRFWNPDSGTTVATLLGHDHPLEDNGAGTTLAWSPDGKTLASADCGDGQLRVWNPVHGKCLRVLHHDAKNIPTPIAWLSDSQHVALGCGGQVRLWQDNAEQAVSMINLNRPGGIFGVAWSSDQKHVAVAGSNFGPKNPVLLFDAETGELCRELDGHTGAVHDVAFSPDGATLASAGADSVRLWKVDSGELLLAYEPFHAGAQLVAWSPSGKNLGFVWNVIGASVSDAFTGKQRAFSIEHGGQLVSGLAWSPNGDVVTTTGGTTLKRWNATTGRVLREASTAPSTWRSSHSLALASGGNDLASVGIDGAIRLWQAESLEPTGTLLPLRDDRWLAISAAGHYRGSARAEREFVFVVETDEGQETLTPAEFTERFGWKNDPAMVRLTSAAVEKPLAEVVPAQPSPEPVPATTPSNSNRQVAEWVLRHGGTVHCYGPDSAGLRSYATALDQLPDDVEQFISIGINASMAAVPEADVIAQLRQVRGEIVSLSVRDYPLTDEGMLAMTKIPALAAITGLAVFRVNLTDAGFALVSAFPELETVSIVQCELTDRGLAYLRALPKLIGLELGQNRISDAGMADLRGMKLASLDLQHNVAITGAGLAHLAEMRTLRSLRLQDTRIGDQGMASLQALPDLERLLIGYTNVTEIGLAVIPKFKKLRLLDIYTLPVTSELLDRICELPQLTELSIGGDKMRLRSAGMKSLTKLHKLESLMLNGPQVTDDWLEPIGKLTTLTELTLTGTKVTAAGVEKLHAALPRCRIISDHGTIEPVPVTTADPEPESTMNAPLVAGQPLSDMALVQRPAKLDGVKNWTLETAGHRGAIFSVAYSPDGKWLASSGDDGSIRIYDSATGKLARCLIGHAKGGPPSGHEFEHNWSTSWVRIAWSPDSHTLASFGLDGTLRLWDPSNGRILRTLATDRADGVALLQIQVAFVAWSPDGSTLATTGRYTTMLWDAATLKSKGTLGEGPFGALAWSPDSAYLALTSGDGAVQIWDVASAKKLHSWIEEKSAASLAWSPDGEIVAVGRTSGTNCTVSFRNTSTGRELRSVLFDAAWVIDLAWPRDHDGPLAAVGDSSGGKFFSVDSGLDAPKLLFPYAGNASAIDWSPDGKSVAIANYAGTLQILSRESSSIVQTLAGHEPCWPHFSWSPDRMRFSSPQGPGIGKVVAIRDSGSGDPISTLNDSALVQDSNWSRTGAKVASTRHEQPHLWIWDVDSGRLERTLDSPAALIAPAIWSPDGTHVACIDPQGVYRIWNVASGMVEHTLEGHKPPYSYTYCSWSPDGKRLAARGSNDEAMLVWDAEAGNVVHKLPLGFRPVAWSANAETMATGSDDGTVRHWDLGTGDLVDTLDQAKGSPITDLDWLPGGNEWFCMTADKKLRVFDAETNRLLRTTELPAFGTLSPDRKLLAAVGANVLRFWEVETGEPQGAIVLLRNDRELVVSPDGHYRSKSKIERDIVYVVETDEGQQTLSPAEFAEKYGWKNDPERVHLSDESK